MHECYVLDAVSEGVEIRPEGVRLFRRDELGGPFFHDYEGELVPIRRTREGVRDVERCVNDVQYS